MDGKYAMKLVGLGESEGDWLVRSIGARLPVRRAEGYDLPDSFKPLRPAEGTASRGLGPLLGLMSAAQRTGNGRPIAAETMR